MRRVEWNQQKSRELKQRRGVSFEDVVRWRLVDIIQHPARSDQRLYIFAHENYCWVVPCVTTDEHIFLKTIYRSRKYTKKYLHKEP